VAAVSRPEMVCARCDVSCDRKVDSLHTAEKYFPVDACGYKLSRASSRRCRICVARKNVSHRTATRRAGRNAALFYLGGHNEHFDDVRRVPISLHFVPFPWTRQGRGTCTRFQQNAKPALCIHSLCNLSAAAAGKPAFHRTSSW